MPRIDHPTGPLGFDPIELHPPAPTAPPAAEPLAPGRGALPDVLFRTANAVVEHGTDPGDFYCEHLFFAAQHEAARPGTSIRTNAHGERLVGFLHVPRDDQAGGAAPPYTQEDRHRGTREVVGAAIRGYVGDVLAGDPATEPVRILLTGYGPFGNVQNNPTGEFVSHPENVDAALVAAFGRDLLTPCGQRFAGAAPGETILRYRVRGEGGAVRTIDIAARPLEVSDVALDPRDARSVQRAISGFRPHAVISMGVASYPTYRAEYHADDGALRPAPGGGWRHADGEGQTGAHPDNYSLARAIHGGACRGPLPAWPREIGDFPAPYGDRFIV